ncbi:MAG: restriction endonuclease [Cyclobacteriaceae bacterium]
MTGQIRIKKHSGELDPFSEDKLRNSLSNAGAKQNVVDEVLAEIKPDLYDGIKSSEVYRSAHRSLKKKEHINSSRYGLKKSILQLGPTGYPFEVLVSEIMASEGYAVQTGITLPGKHVTHEIDVLAESNAELLMMECKFHNKPGYKSDVKVPLYINSRYRDVDDIWKRQGKYSEKNTQGCVITNSRFTQDALDYGLGEGMQMISWDYPAENSLKKRINDYHLYPITSLQSITQKDKKLLIEEGIVAIKSLCENFDLLGKLGYSNNKISKIVSEANLVCEI